jgi:polyphosphate kinase
MKLIAREKAKGADGYICMKINHLTDAKLVKALQDAANEGVRMDLVVRTTYALAPHPNIRAISILDRYLEHQRAYVFGEGDGRLVFMSSADLMERNLDWRVECAFPVYDEELQQEIVDLLQLQIHDTCKARVLDATQSNVYVDDRHGGLRAQTATYAYYIERWKKAADSA